MTIGQKLVTILQQGMKPLQQGMKPESTDDDFWSVIRLFNEKGKDS